MKPVLQCGRQDAPKQRQTAAIQGRVARLLDMSDKQEALVVASITRLVAELVCAEYDKDVIISALNKMRDAAWCSLRECRKMVDATKREARQYVEAYDLVRITQSEQDRLQRKREPETAL